MAIITVPKPLREKLGDEGSDALVELLNKTGDRQKEDVLEFVEEKFERRLSEEVGKLRGEIQESRVEIQQTRADLVDRIERSHTGLVDRIERSHTDLVDRIERSHTGLVDRIETTRADLIKWVFIFWVGQIVALTGILFAFFK